MSQTNQILAHLKRGKPITALGAIGLYGCTRLASRINEIRNMGVNVETKFVSIHGKTFGSYSIKK